MKIFSSLLAFVMIFAFVATAYADVAPYPRPRPRPANQIVTAEVNDNDELIITLSFPVTCNYKYQIFDANGAIVKWGKDSCDLGDTAEVIVYPDSKLVAGEKKYYLLKLNLSNIQEQTRFGAKIRRDEKSFTKTLVFEKNSDDTTVKVLEGDVRQ